MPSPPFVRGLSFLAAHWRHTAGQKTAIIDNEAKQDDDRRAALHLRWRVVGYCE